MRKKDLIQLVRPTLSRSYSLAMAILPDDLQAGQLMIDAFLQYLLKEKKFWLDQTFDEKNTKQVMDLRKIFFKGFIKAIVDLGEKRSNQHIADYRGKDFSRFYQMDTKMRAIIWLKYKHQLSIQEIERILGIKSYEVIEKIHNGRYLLLNQSQVELSSASILPWN